MNTQCIPTPKITDQQLYDKYHRLVYTVAQKIKRIYYLNSEDAEDIAQHAFLRLFSLNPDQRNHPYKFIITVINNACRDELRKILGYQKRITFYQASPETNVEESCLFEDQRQDFEDPTIARLTLDEVMEELDAEQKDVLTLAAGIHHHQPHTIKKISGALKMPQSKVKQVLEESFEQIRKAM